MPFLHANACTLVNRQTGIGTEIFRIIGITVDENIAAAIHIRIRISATSGFGFYIKRTGSLIAIIWNNDINHFTGLQVDYLAELKITDQVHWGFNGFNAVMLFKQKCDEYTSINKLGEEFVEMKYNPDIGYWFGEIKEETIDSDINLYYKED